MTDYNKLRELSIKRILNNFKVVLKNNFLNEEIQNSIK